MRPLLFTCQAVALTCVWLILSTAAGAAPNTDDPGDALATRKEPKLQQLAADAAEQYKTANDIIVQMVEKLEGDQVSKINPKQFGTSWVAILRTDRIGKHLENLGETAGVDFQVRAAGLRSAWRQLNLKYYEADTSKVNYSALYQQVSSQAMRRARALAKVQSSVDKQEWEEAWKLIHTEIDELEILGCWLPPEQRRPMKPFEELRDIISPNLDALQKAEGLARLTELREQATPKFDDLITQLQQASKDMRAGNDPTYDGQTCSGPELLQKAGASWRQLHWSALQCLGIDWSRGMRLKEADAQPLQELINQHKDFASKVIPAFADVIAADAGRTNAADAPKLYAGYVEALAPILTLTGNDEWAASFQPQLDSLAALSPALAADVKAYDAVTSDLLRWRKRLASAQQKNLAAEFPKFAPTAVPSLKVRPSETVGTVTIGIISKDAKDTSEIALISPLPQSLERIKQELVGKKVTLPAAIGLNPTTKLVASNYSNRHYATFTLPAGFDQQVAALKADLLVSENLPPLTLKAAMAIASAERGDLHSAGVTINRVYAEPLSTRMAGLPAMASVLVPLGSLPAEPMGNPSLSQLLLRSDVGPSWVRHAYFLIPPQSK